MQMKLLILQVNLSFAGNAYDFRVILSYRFEIIQIQRLLANFKFLLRRPQNLKQLFVLKINLQIWISRRYKLRFAIFIQNLKGQWLTVKEY